MKDLAFLYQPVKPFIITQKFGENKGCISNHDNKTVIACDGHNPPPGFRSVYSMMKGHSGIDLVAKRWQPIYASQNGTVYEVETERGRGLGIGIVTDDKYYCIETKTQEHFKYRNWHLIAMNVNDGDKVKTGQLIGWADNTGFSSGDHDHFELKPVSVLQNGRMSNILQDNGYFGAVDPEPYLYDIFALDIATISGNIRKIREKLALLVDRVSDLLRN